MNEVATALTRVLIIEDDIGMRQMLSDYLTSQSMTVTGGSSRRDVSVLSGTHMPDIIVLDLRLDHDDGLDLLREIRHRSDVPLIIITGHSKDEIDRIIGLELGADDYLTKPFSPRELLARMRAVLRRQQACGRISRAAEKAQGFDFNGWRLDQRRRELRNPSGQEVLLTKGEFALLVAFLEAPARPLSREHLLQTTRVHEDVFDRSIDVQVLRLRRKLEIDPTSPQLIQTERGIGYKFLGRVTSH